MMGIMALQINIDAVGADMSEWSTVRETYFERTVKRMRLIDADALYEKTAEWEAQALAQTERYNPIDSRSEWLRWSFVLKERSAFKFDVADAPTIDAVEVVRCKDCAKREYCRTTNVWATVPDDNWFCADAERRSE